MSLPAAFISVILIWSTTPLAIKWSALGIGSSFAVLSRMLVGALLCMLLLALLRVRFPLHRKAWLSYTASGLSMFGAMALTYWSAQYVSSGMISVLFGLSPLITSLGAALWLKEEAITPNKLAGMLLGVLGFALYYYMIKHMEAGHIALITLVTPVLALLLGHGLNDEAVLPQVWLGTASIILGLCLHRWGGQWLAYLPMRR